jgi:hypothetical protein
MISTVNLLTGVPSAAAEVQMDSLYEFWSGGPVHGEKIAYSKIALGLLDLLDRKLPEGDLRFNLSSRKRGQDSSGDRRGSGGTSYNNNRSVRDLTFRSDGDTPGSSRASRSDRDPTTRDPPAPTGPTRGTSRRRGTASAARAARVLGVTTNRVVTARRLVIRPTGTLRSHPKFSLCIYQ